MAWQNKLEKQIEDDHSKFLEEQQHAEKRLTQIKHERDQSIKEHEEQKQKLEIQLGELNHNLLQVGGRHNYPCLLSFSFVRYQNHCPTPPKQPIFNERNLKNKL